MLLVEDLIIDSCSKINFVNVLCIVGVMVNYCFVLFYYNIFKESVLVLKDIDVDLYVFVMWWDVLCVVKVLGYFEMKMFDEVEKFLYVLVEWLVVYGGVMVLKE